MRRDLLSLVAARTGHFLLESGHHGTLWLDLDTLFLRPARVLPLAGELAGRLARHRPAVICGPLLGGAFLAQMVATALGAEFTFAERSSTGSSIEYRIPAGLRAELGGKTAAIVDDAINAGSAARSTIAALEACGARVVAAGALLVLGTTGSSYFSERGTPLVSLAALPNQLWEPPLCPLCAAGTPVEEPD
jgi:orotate phosphoribosyltransferase